MVHAMVSIARSFACSLLLAAGAPTLRLPGLEVELDAARPRPARILYKPAAVDFSAPLDPEGSEVPARDLPTSTGCLTLLALDGSATRFCSGVTDYSVEGPTARWRFAVANGSGAFHRARLWGEMSVSAGAAEQLEWTLTGVEAFDAGGQAAVRAVDIGWAFLGLQDGFYQHTRSNKHWCPPGTPCQEWSHPVSVKQVGEWPEAGNNSGWAPPGEPWAHVALLRAGRSQFLGAWTRNGAAGVAAHSTQRTLPFQVFRGDGAVGLGSARINTELRCGSQLPVTLRWGFYSDLTSDGRADGDDAAVFVREQYPLSDQIYRTALVVKLQTDITSYNRSKLQPRILFNETLKYVRALSELSDAMPLVVHLVGWQGTGHDTDFPSYDHVNPMAGTSAQLRQLAEACRNLNVVLSYHVNTDEAYWNYTVFSSSGAHPVPGTRDGQHNPDCDPEILARDPAGQPWIWGADNPPQSDPLQGYPIHISKTKDAVSGQRLQRFEAMRSAIPLDTTLHMDAYRDIDTSWEADSRGYIAEDEELACGVVFDHRWLKSQSLSLGVECANGMASVGGPASPCMDIFNYYWHGGWTLGEWARTVSGTDQGLDNDIFPGSTTDPLTNWAGVADSVYLSAKKLSLQLSDPNRLSATRFGAGGNLTHWPYVGGWLEYAGRISSAAGEAVDCVLVPRIVAAPGAATRIDPTTLYFYARSGAGNLTVRWPLPPGWRRARAELLHPSGRTLLGTQHDVLDLELPRGRPLVLRRDLSAVVFA